MKNIIPNTHVDKGLPIIKFIIFSVILISSLVLINSYSYRTYAEGPNGGGNSNSTTESQNAVCQGSQLKFGDIQNPDDKACKFKDDTAKPTKTVNDLIAQGINIFSVIVGIVAVVMILVGGFRYITSSGDSAKLTSARNTIVYALIGLVIVVFAQFIVKFVLDKAVNAS